MHESVGSVRGQTDVSNARSQKKSVSNFQKSLLVQKASGTPSSEVYTSVRDCAIIIRGGGGLAEKWASSSEKSEK